MTRCLLPALLFLGGAEGFITSLPRLPTRDITPTPGRCRVPRLALTPPRKPNAGAGAGSAAAGGDDNGGANDVLKSTSEITRAPLRITPNFQPQEKRRPKTFVDQDITYGAFLTEESFDIAGEWTKFPRFENDHRVLMFFRQNSVSTRTDCNLVVPDVTPSSTYANATVNPVRIGNRERGRILVVANTSPRLGLHSVRTTVPMRARE